MRNARALSLTALLVLVFGAALVVAEEPAEKSAPQIKVTIGKETTYSTQPLRPDGYPDYVAAINQIYGGGTTPDSNAAVLLQRAFGPDGIDRSIRAEWYTKLGLALPTTERDFFVTDTEMIKKLQVNRSAEQIDAIELDSRKQFDEAQMHPWKEAEYPLAVKWLEINAQPLRTIVEASRCKKQWFPTLVENDYPLITVPIPQDQKLRSAANALSTRAMLYAGRGDIVNAWQQLQACHRLARLTSQGPWIVDLLTGYAIEDIAVRGDIALFHYLKLKDEDLVKMRADLRALPPFISATRTIDIGERFMALDMALHIDREGAKTFDALFANGKESQPNAFQEFILNDALLDWNVPLQMLNRWYDRALEITRIDAPKGRRVAASLFENDIHKLTDAVKSPRLLLWDLFSKNSAKDLMSPRVGGILVIVLLPALQAIRNAEERIKLVDQMDQIAIGLARYRASHNSYPDDLHSLVPKYLQELPLDTFADESTAIHYRREENAYVMWTVHINGIDENGRNEEDDPPGDDYAIRPLPTVKTK